MVGWVPRGSVTQKTRLLQVMADCVAVDGRCLVNCETQDDLMIEDGGWAGGCPGKVALAQWPPPPSVFSRISPPSFSTWTLPSAPLRVGVISKPREQGPEHCFWEMITSLTILYPILLKHFFSGLRHVINLISDY